MYYIMDVQEYNSNTLWGEKLNTQFILQHQHSLQNLCLEAEPYNLSCTHRLNTTYITIL